MVDFGKFNFDSGLLEISGNVITWIGRMDYAQEIMRALNDAGMIVVMEGMIADDGVTFVRFRVLSNSGVWSEVAQRLENILHESARSGVYACCETS